VRAWSAGPGPAEAVAPKHPRVVLVTDPSFGDARIARAVAAAADAFPPGWLCVQLRDKRRPRSGLRLFAMELRRITGRAGAWLVVNGDVGVARDAGAEGVHFGGGAGPNAPAEARRACGEHAWVSVAAHSDEDVRAAVASGADAALVSPIFASRPPAILSPLGSGAKVARGTAALVSARAIAEGEVGATGRCPRGRLLVFALGGVTAERARRCVVAGADGVGVVRDILDRADPFRAARALHDALSRRC